MCYCVIVRIAFGTLDIQMRLIGSVFVAVFAALRLCFSIEYKIEPIRANVNFEEMSDNVDIKNVF